MRLGYRNGGQTAGLVRSVDLGDGRAMNVFGNRTTWTRYGVLHREDGPAIESKDGNQWWAEGTLHREDGPAVVYPFGHAEWWCRGKRHRVDGPAIEMPESETYSWYLMGRTPEPEREQRLLSAMLADPDQIACPEEFAMTLVGNDPWVAHVLLRNDAMMAVVGQRAAGFLMLLAGPDGSFR